MNRFLILTIAIISFFGIFHDASAQYSNGQIINLINQTNKNNEELIKRKSLREQNEADEELYTIEEAEDSKLDKAKKPKIKVKNKNN